MKRLIKVAVATLFAAALMTGAWAGSADSIRLPNWGWTGKDISTLILGTLLEKIGYTVEYMFPDPDDPLFKAVAEGNIDMAPDVFMDIADDPYTEHRHAGIAMLTPHDVHHGRARRVLEQRERTLRLAWNRHPERFVHGTPKPQPLPQQVWINPPAAAATPRPAQ